MFLTVTLLTVGSLFGLDIYTHHGDEIIVPNLKGMSAEKAELKLSELGLEMEVADSGFVRSLPPGTILGQNIAAGEKVKPGRIIYLIINTANSPTIALPDISDNCSEREAESRLTAVGFKMGPTEYIDGEKDWVYSVKANGRIVPTGTRISVGTPITLIVGNGKSQTTSSDDDEDFGYVGDDNFDDTESLTGPATDETTESNTTEPTTTEKAKENKEPAKTKSK